MRFTDFSKDALVNKFLPWSEAYMQLYVDGWAHEVAKRCGIEAEIEWMAWNLLVVPEIERMKQEFLPAGRTYEDPKGKVPENERVGTRVTYPGLFTPDSSTVELSKPEIVTWLLGSHEYLLQCIEAWATQINNPLRARRDVVCCKWRFSMRAPDDPEYEKDPGELTTKPDRTDRSAGSSALSLPGEGRAQSRELTNRAESAHPGGSPSRAP